MVVGSIARLAKGSIEEKSNTESTDCLIGVEAVDAGLVVEKGVVTAGTAKGDCIGSLASSAGCTGLKEVVGAETSAIS